MNQINPIEQKLLLEGIFLKYGYDFRQYAEASLTRRLSAILMKYHFADAVDLLKQVLNDKTFFNEILPLLTVTTTEMFRDPTFFAQLREDVIPVLKTYPHVNIWVAGCSSGEEVYSLAILLKEEQLLGRATIFATDINSQVLKTAREGIYSLENVKAFTRNYALFGGKASPSDYYLADYGWARFDPQLRENVVFSEHNLVLDNVFTEAHLILCRNVLIYFNRELQDRVFGLFSQSLASRGFLGLGSKEALRFSKHAHEFTTIHPQQRIFQKNPGLSAKGKSAS